MNTEEKKLKVQFLYFKVQKLHFEIDFIQKKWYTFYADKKREDNYI